MKTTVGFDELEIIRTLERIERATAIGVRVSKILMHPEFFTDWITTKHPDFFPPKNELKFGVYPLKITNHVKKWGLVIESYD